jgi:Helix-turn-helix domain
MPALWKLPLESQRMTVVVPEQDAYLTGEELGRILRLKPATVSEWAREGRIPSVRLSPKIVRYKLNDVLAALSSRQTPGSTEVHP